MTKVSFPGGFVDEVAIAVDAANASPVPIGTATRGSIFIDGNGQTIDIEASVDGENFAQLRDADGKAVKIKTHGNVAAYVLPPEVFSCRVIKMTGFNSTARVAAWREV